MNVEKPTSGESQKSIDDSFDQAAEEGRLFQLQCFNHVKDTPAFRREFRQSLAPGGYLVRTDAEGTETAFLPSTQVPEESVREELRAEARRLLAEKRRLPAEKRGE